MNYLRILLVSLPLLLLSACDDDEYHDNTPPEGQGGLIVVNDRPEGMRVFIDGEAQADVGDYDDRAYNLEPGVHRVILDAKKSRGAFIQEVEILAGRNVVLLVEDSGANDIYVRVQLD